MPFTRRQYLALVGASMCRAAETEVLEQWRGIAHDTDGTLGAAALHVGSGQGISLRGSERFPLASVCKLPIAIHIFALIDEHKLSLEDLIDVPVSDLFPGVSEVAERWTKQKRFAVRELVELMVEKSDNTAVQALLRTGGGPAAMTARLEQWRVRGIRIDRSERRCTLDADGVKNIPPESQWTPELLDRLEAAVPPRERLAALRRFLDDPRDTGTPDATVELLSALFRGELLSEHLTHRLIQILEATTTGPARIKGLLPPGTLVAHKTGTTGTVMRLNGSTNDVGVIQLPGAAGQLALAVYLKGSSADQAARDKTIARVARVAFDYWSH